MQVSLDKLKKMFEKNSPSVRLFVEEAVRELKSCGERMIDQAITSAEESLRQLKSKEIGAVHN